MQVIVKAAIKNGSFPWALYPFSRFHVGGPASFQSIALDGRWRPVFYHVLLSVSSNRIFFHGWIRGIYCWRECQGTLYSFDLSKLNDFVPSTAFRKTQMVVWFLCLCASWTLSPKVAGPTSTLVMPTTPMTFWCIVSWCAMQWAGGKVVQVGLVKRTWMALDIWEWYVGQRIWQFRLWAGLGEDLWSNWWFVYICVM